MPPRGGWSDLQIAYMRWLCLPSDKDMGGKGKGLRDPATVTEFALKHGIDISLLYKWQAIEGWDQAFATVAEQTFKALKPLYLKNLTVSLLKPDPNDRLFTAAVRYVEPIIDDHERDGIWQQNLPRNNGNFKSLDISQAQRLERYRALPTEQREIILEMLGEMMSQDQGTSDSTPYYSVMKPFADDDAGPDEPQPKALPAPAVIEPQPGQPAATTSTSTSSSTAGAKYNPRLRKPLRKPKD